MIYIFEKKNISMGKGDKKTKKGKIFMGTYGNSRARKSIKSIVSSEEKKGEAKKKTTKKK